jgi:hypothetical protein
LHITKFDKGFTRRHVLEGIGKSALFAGSLAPLWDIIARDGDISKAYPEETLSIELMSGGAVKPGGMIDAGNVGSVKHLLDPGTFIQISQQGRVVKMAEKTTTDILSLNPRSYIEATLRNRYKALIDAKGNVIVAGMKPWIGGNPFPGGGSAHEILASHVLNWSRRDSAAYPIVEWDMNADGEQQFHYHYYFVEAMATGRVLLDPKPYMNENMDILRYHTVMATAPADFRPGTSLVSQWNTDQTKWPNYFAYLPDLKRIMRWSVLPRFEPLVPGTTMTATDVPFWMMGDPFLTWGNFKLKGAAPWLGAVSDTWNGKADNWAHARVGGKSGRKFFQSTFELIPEVFAIDMEPVAYSTSPYSKKRVWFDARTMTPVAMNIFDHAGKLWKSAESGTSLFRTKDGTQWPAKGDPYWSWTYCHMHDFSNDNVSIFEQAEHVDGGFKARYDAPNLYDQFCTIPAVRRLGK